MAAPNAAGSAGDTFKPQAPTQLGRDVGGRLGGGRFGEAGGKRGGRGFAEAGRLANVVVLLLLVFAVLGLVIVPRATGSQTYTVLTDSMAPTYYPGTFLVVKPAAFSELKYGDIITFQRESGKPAVETHRIVDFGATETGERTVITKGDNNGVNDPKPVRALQIRGKVFYSVPLVGYVALGNEDRDLWMTVAAAGLFASSALLIFRTVGSRRRSAG